MRKIENPQEFRNNVINKLKDILKNDKLASNLEKGIFNYCLKHAEKINVVKKWDNNYFVKIYVNRLRTIRSNLKDEKLFKSIINKKIKAHEVAFMTHQEMQPDNWSELLELKKIRDENKYEPKLEASTDDFKCWKCKSKKCTYYQLQTRSADEPMTTFVSCLDCGNRWKC
jgi:transcription elongation factor S-II